MEYDTAIDLPLIDGGPAFAALFFVVVGWLVGTVWLAAQRGFASATALYALYSCVLAYAAIQNNFFAPHIVGASLLAVLFIGAAELREHRRRCAAMPATPDAA